MSKTICRMTLFLLALFVVCVGCGSGSGSGSSSNTETSNLYLDSAYTNFQNGDQTKALLDVNTATSYKATEDALLFKSQVEYATGDNTSADTTLDQYNSLYPDGAGDDLLNAYYLSYASGDCDSILVSLETALNQDYGGLGCDTYWDFVESDDGFAYFRNTCSSQYTTLEDQKTTCEEVGAAARCRQNVSKLDKHWWGLQLYTDHNTTEGLEAGASFVSLCLRVFDTSFIAKAVASVISARAAEARARDRGCGVIFSWTWANFNPTIGTTGLYLYWLSSQK